MTITVHKETSVSAKGTHRRRNSKPIFCITTGEIFSSVGDAADAIGVDISTMSHALLGKVKTCKGKRFCYVTNITEHLEEISQQTQSRNEKVLAYDKAIAKKEALSKATEKLAKHRARYEKLAQQLEREIDLIHEAEREVDMLKQQNNHTIFEEN